MMSTKKSDYDIGFSLRNGCRFAIVFHIFGLSVLCLFNLFIFDSIYLIVN